MAGLEGGLLVLRRNIMLAKTERGKNGGYTTKIRVGVGYTQLTEGEVINAFMSLAKAQCEYKASTHNEYPTHSNIVSWAIGIVQNEGSDSLTILREASRDAVR